MSKWAVSPEQTDLNYNDFAKDNLDYKETTKNLDDFKKMTDR